MHGKGKSPSVNQHGDTFLQQGQILGSEFIRGIIDIHRFFIDQIKYVHPVPGQFVDNKYADRKQKSLGVPHPNQGDHNQIKNDYHRVCLRHTNVLTDRDIKVSTMLQVIDHRADDDDQ